MFDTEFYPTPNNVLEQLDIDCRNKVCLEPSAGKGNIADWLMDNGASKVITVEKHHDLVKILQTKYQVIGTDFFKITPEQVSHIHCIIMNPPFSNADKHIIHAWEIAPDGCEIVALCNSNTIENSYTATRKQLLTLIKDYGDASQTLVGAFKGAERPTDVDVKVVRLFKPAIATDFDYEGFYFDADERINETDGIVKYDYIQSLVNSYISLMRCFDNFKEVADQMNLYTQQIKFGRGIKFEVSYNESITTKLEFASALQKHLWKLIFKELKIERFVTQGVMQDINKFIEHRNNYPFTIKNIYQMFSIIIGTRSQIMSRALVEAVDNYTKYTHENRYAVEGWKTNKGHLLNQKFIINNISRITFSGNLEITYYSQKEQLHDLIKVLCYLTGKNYDDLTPIEYEVYENKLGAQDFRTRTFKPNVWYDHEFFEFKVFKKGTGHFKFKDIKVWEMVNKAYAEAKGQVLPEKI